MPVQRKHLAAALATTPKELQVLSSHMLSTIAAPVLPEVCITLLAAPHLMVDTEGRSQVSCACWQNTLHAAQPDATGCHMASEHCTHLHVVDVDTVLGTSHVQVNLPSQHVRVQRAADVVHERVAKVVPVSSLESGCLHVPAASECRTSCLKQPQQPQQRNSLAMHVTADMQPPST
jgi:hypothetical protein